MEQGEQKHAARPLPGPAIGQKDGPQTAAVNPSQAAARRVAHEDNGQDDLVGGEAQQKRQKNYPIQPHGPAQRFQKRCAAGQQRAAAQQQADKLLAAARENAENDRKKIVAEANREAVSIAEAAMEKLLAKETSHAYDAFVNAAEGEEKHEHE